MLAQQGINPRKFDFARHGHALGRVLQHEHLDVRMVQNVALTKPVFDGDLHLFSGESRDLDGSSHRQSYFAQVIDTEFAR